MALLILEVPFGGAKASGRGEPVLSGSVLALSRECARNVHPLTMGYLVAAESANNRFAVGVNGHYRLPRQPATLEEAAATIRWLEANGYNFDVGWGQVNSDNFTALKVSGVGLLDGCTNLRAAAQVLSDCYATAANAVGEGQAALHRALSCYNTGSYTQGFRNGYVGKLVATATRLQVPALLGNNTVPAEGNGSSQHGTSDDAEDEQAPAPLGTPGAFAHPASGAFASTAPGASQTNEQHEPNNARLPDSATSTGGSIQR